jgi:3D (Asp-Asp-Asp) domain-containing protein
MNMRRIQLLKWGLAWFVIGCPLNMTHAATTVTDAADGSSGKRMVRTTAYTHARHAKSASGSPLHAGGLNSAAADWSRFPLGTKFKIADTDRIYVVDDYGSALVGTNTIDLYMPTRRAMRHWGVRKVAIEIVEAGSFARSLAVLKGRRHVPYVRKMVKALERRV